MRASMPPKVSHFEQVARYSFDGPTGEVIRFKTTVTDEFDALGRCGRRTTTDRKEVEADHASSRFGEQDRRSSQWKTLSGAAFPDSTNRGNGTVEPKEIGTPAVLPVSCPA